jgi:hypothetical protein
MGWTTWYRIPGGSECHATLAWGAGVHIQSGPFGTAVQAARQMAMICGAIRHRSYEAALLRKILQLLIEQGADVNADLWTLQDRLAETAIQLSRDGRGAAGRPATQLETAGG